MPERQDTELVSRREFLRSVGRHLALGGLAALAAGLAARRLRQSGKACPTPDVICRACPVFGGGCGLPRASAARGNG